MKNFIKERLGTIIVLLIVVIFFGWGYFSIEKAKTNAITYKDDYVAPEGNRLEGDGTYNSIAKDDHLELLYNEIKGTIQVKDLDNGYLWKGVCDNDVYDLTKINKQWAGYLQSPITLTYSDLKKRDSAPNTVYGATDCKFLESEYIENGVAVTYGFLKPGIYVTVEYLLDNGQFVVRVPVDKIREESKFAVITMEILPYFGAAGNEVDGYLLYPDGSGAITSYAKAGERNANVKGAMWYPYGNRFTSFTNIYYKDNYDRYTAALPVFGIKNDNNAILGAITSGAENAGIVAYPSGYVVDLNHIGCELYIRNVFNVNLYNMATGSEGVATGGTIQRVDKKIIAQDREIRYFLLSGDDANYSGMAKAYREYLLETGELKADSSVDNNMTLGLNLLMGARKAGMVFEEYVPMTSFEQTVDILEELKAQNITNVEMVLESWTAGNGADYNIWGPHSALGGSNGLSKIDQYLKNNEDISLYLQNQFVIGSKTTKGISEDKDVAYDGLNIEIAATSMDGTIHYLLSPSAIKRRNSEFLKKLSKFSKLGVGYERLGSAAYADYNENEPLTKTQSVEVLKNTLNDTKATDRKIAISGANKYVYGNADYLYNLREEEYGLAITDRGVPFLEMVISGLIPYSTEGAGNLSYDLDYQKLKWIEYGSIPYFKLTYESAQNLRETDYSTLFSSTWSDWKDTVVSVYNEFNNNLNDICNKEMIQHEVITDDVVCVTYDNGTSIFINYGNDVFTTNGVSVPAMGYVVVKGGAN